MKHRPFIAIAALVAAASVVVADRSAPLFQPALADLAPMPDRVLYIANAHLWLKPVDGGAAQKVPAPWPVSRAQYGSANLQWSTNHQWLALDDTRSRLAVIDLIHDHTTILMGQTCGRNCAPPVFAWSPNSRYLAFLKEPANGQRAVLSVWDSATNRTRTLLTDVSSYVASPEWSHDSTRIAVPVGRFDTIRSVFPSIEVVTLNGSTISLGKGTDPRWSPDDRFVGIISPYTCGANTCGEDVLVAPSSGGKAVLLRRHSSSLFDDPIWSPLTHPYVFDRWELNASGHPVRQLAGPHEITLSWNPTGTRLALQTYYPYQGTPDVLYLSTLSGTRTRLYKDGWNAGCGACSKGGYSLAWSTGDSFAWTTPTYSTVKNVIVNPKVYVSSLTGGSPTHVPVPSRYLTTLLGFADNGRLLVIHDGSSLYTYAPATSGLVTLARGVLNGYDSAFLASSTSAG